MSSRELVMQRVCGLMQIAFNKGDFIDAQNMEAFISSLEGLSDSEYEVLACEADREQIGL